MDIKYIEGQKERGKAENGFFLSDKIIMALGSAGPAGLEVNMTYQAYLEDSAARCLLYA